MHKVKRGAKRSNAGDMPVQLILRDPANGSPIADTIPAMLENISVAGASLAMKRIRTGDQHIFYAGQDSDVPMLFLEVNTGGESPNSLSIPLSPVWFNCEGSDEDTIFRMGVEFVKTKDDRGIVALIKMACGGQQGSKWFSKNFCALTRGVMGRFCWRRRSGEG